MDASVSTQVESVCRGPQEKGHCARALRKSRTWSFHDMSGVVSASRHTYRGMRLGVKKEEVCHPGVCTACCASAGAMHKYQILATVLAVAESI